MYYIPGCAERVGLPYGSIFCIGKKLKLKKLYLNLLTTYGILE